MLDEIEVFDEIRFVKSSELEKLVHQMKVDPDKFQDDILLIEQELLLRTLPFCRPIIDLI